MATPAPAWVCGEAANVKRLYQCGAHGPAVAGSAKGIKRVWFGCSLLWPPGVFRLLCVLKVGLGDSETVGAPVYDITRSTRMVLAKWAAPVTVVDVAWSLVCLCLDPTSEAVGSQGPAPDFAGGTCLVGECAYTQSSWGHSSSSAGMW